MLELFNYIAHYGLVRGEGADGKLEALSDRHSWNSSNVLANALVFVGRCHRQPAAAYQTLRRRDARLYKLGYCRQYSSDAGAALMNAGA